MTERAATQIPWLDAGPRAQVKPERAAVGGGGYAGPPGRRRLVRAVPVRRRLRAREAGGAAPRLPRPGHRSPQPRRRRAERGGRRRDGSRHPRARFRPRHAGRLPRVRRCRRARPDRRRPEPRALPRRCQGQRAVGVRGRLGGHGLDVGRGSHRRRGARVRRGGQGRPPARPQDVRRDRLDPARREGRLAQRLASRRPCCSSRRDDSARARDG